MSLPRRCGGLRQRLPSSIDDIRSARERKIKLKREIERERENRLRRERKMLTIRRKLEEKRESQLEWELEMLTTRREMEEERESQLERERIMQLERELEMLKTGRAIRLKRERGIRSGRERLLPDPISVARSCGNSGCVLPSGHESAHKYWHECSQLLCTLPLGHSSPHLFLRRCDEARCILRWGHDGDHAYRAYQYDCSEPGCVLFWGHTLPHEFLRPCSIENCPLRSNHDGPHTDPYSGLSRSVVQRTEEAIKNAALSAHLVDEMVFRTMGDEKIMNTADSLAIEHLPTDFPTDATRTEFVRVGYSKLDTSQKQIRLFELYPGMSGSDIKGSFHYVELSAELEYVALSYTWGDEATYGEIQVEDGMKIPVRENLWWFLRSQSSSISESKLYWVDAICINQSDVNERNHQVGLMRQIYTNATTVYVWLGCESSNSNLAMDYMTENASKKLKNKGLGYRPIWSEQEGEALVELCERPYWRRMWIIQEVISAANIVVWCGTRSFDWGLIIQLYQKLKILESTHWLTHHAFAMRVFQSSAGVIIWQRAYWRHPDTPTPTLKTLINVFHSWKCADLRDKVYALVGMASTETAVMPDYSKSIYDICQDVWEKDEQNDAQFYNMLARVLGLRGEPMELGQHSPRYIILRQRFLSAKQGGVLTEADDDEI